MAITCGKKARRTGGNRYSIIRGYRRKKNGRKRSRYHLKRYELPVEAQAQA